MKSKILKSSLTAVGIVFLLASFLEAAEVFTGSFRDYKVDLDGDGKANAFNIDIELNVPKDDNKYAIRGCLAGQCYSKYDLNLKEGKQIISLTFDGYKIFKEKINGPYVLNNLYFGRYLSSTPKDVYEDLDFREVVQIATPYKYTEFEQPDLSFKGAEAVFALSLGQTARIVEGNIGDIEIKLLSINPDSTVISLNNGWRQEIIIGKDVSFITGGLEQTGTLKLLEIKDNTAKFEIEFGSAPPAPEIPDDMPIDIIYLK